jgi:outer membrane protein assembly factor BamB
MAAVDTDTGAVDQAFDPDPDDDVYGLAISGGRLVAAGKFTSAPRTPAQHLAAIEAQTGATSAGFAAGTDAPVTALAVSGGRLFAGGRFTVANGAKRRHLAAFDAATGALSALAVAVDGSIGTLVPDGRRLYLGGSFERVGGRLHPSLAALDLTTSRVLSGFNAPRSTRSAKLRFQSVDAIVPLGRRVLLGGDISVSRTLVHAGRRTFQFRSGLIAVRTADGVVDYAFNAHTSGGVRALVRNGATLYVGGSMSRRSGTRIVPRTSRKGGRRLKPRRVPIYRNNLIAITPATGDLVRAFRPAANEAVTALAQAGGRLYVAGAFETVGGRRRDGLAAVSTTTGTPAADFSPQPLPAENSISALLGDGARLFAAGAFTGFGDVPRAHLAIFAAGGGAAAGGPA